MARLNYSHDTKSGNYTIRENNVTFLMNFSYFSRLNKWLKRNYISFYNEQSEAVLKWYKELTPQDRKDINVQGLKSNDGFFADTFYED